MGVGRKWENSVGIIMEKTIIGAITWISHSNKWRFNDQNFNIQNSARREIKGTQFCQIMPAPYFNHVEIIASQRWTKIIEPKMKNYSAVTFEVTLSVPRAFFCLLNFSSSSWDVFSFFLHFWGLIKPLKSRLFWTHLQGMTKYTKRKE